MNTPSEPVLTPTQRVEAESYEATLPSDEVGQTIMNAVPTSFALQMAGELERTQKKLEDYEPLIGKAAEAMGFIRFIAQDLDLAGPEWSEEPGFSARLTSAWFKFTHEWRAKTEHSGDTIGAEARIKELEQNYEAECVLHQACKESLAQSESGVAGLRMALEKIRRLGASSIMKARNEAQSIASEALSTPAGKSMVARSVLSNLVSLIQDERQMHYAQHVRDVWFEEKESALTAANQELERSGL